MKERRRLGDLLTESGLITKQQLQEALYEQGKNEKLGDVLIKQGYITEQQLIEVLEFQLGIPHVSLYRYNIDENILKIVPKELVKRYRVIPLKKVEDRLLVAMNDPMDFIAMEDLRLATGFNIEQAIATNDDINRAITKYYEMDDSMEEMLKLSNQMKDEIDEERINDDDSPVVRLVNQLLKTAVQQRASDIHFDPHETKLEIRYRIDGVLRTERSLPKHLQNMIIARIKIMSNLNITESRKPQDGRIKVNLDYQPLDFRVSTLPTVFGEKVVLRYLDMSSTLQNIDKLDFSENNLNKFLKMIERTTGIILITGPTGSGKSSTLYASLNRLNTEKVNIITIEDPVEYQLEGINQIQVNPRVGLTFANGLRSILRQDPDIIMVGEIRDQETAEIAVRASLTGHLVLSTLHTNSSISTVMRLIDMGIEPFLVAASLSGVVAQRLVRKICRDCKEEQHPTVREREIFAKRGIQIEKLYRGRGCPTCNMTGYKGRMAIHEVLVINDDMKQIIMNQKSVTELRDYATENGTIYLIDDGLSKVAQGLTTTEEILRVTIDE